MTSTEQDLQTSSDWQAQGCLLCTIEQYPAAIAAFDQALSVEPNNYQTWNYRGNALSALNRQAEALTCYDKAVALNPAYHQAWFNRGLLLAEMGAFGSALAAYDQALSIYCDPYYVHARANIWLKQKLVPLS